MPLHLAPTLRAAANLLNSRNLLQNLPLLVKPRNFAKFAMPEGGAEAPEAMDTTEEAAQPPEPPTTEDTAATLALAAPQRARTAAWLSIL